MRKNIVASLLLGTALSVASVGLAAAQDLLGQATHVEGLQIGGKQEHPLVPRNHQVHSGRQELLADARVGPEVDLPHLRIIAHFRRLAARDQLAARQHNQAIGMCDGNMRSAIKALLLVNEYLEAEIEQLQAEVSDHVAAHLPRTLPRTQGAA